MAAASIVALNQAVGLIGKVADALQAIPNAVRGFVDAFNPQAGLNLDRAFRSLYATVGYALEPVLSAATQIVDGFAGALMGGMDALRGPVEKVAGAFAGALRPAVEAAGTVMDALAEAAGVLEPLLRPIGTALEGLAAVTKVLTAIFTQGLLAAVQALLPGADALRDATDFLVAAFVQVADASIRYAEIVLLLAGAQNRMIPILEAILKSPARTGRPEAPQGFGIGGLEDLYRRRLVAAAAGGGKPVEERTFDVMQQIREVAKEILDQIKNRPDQFERNQDAFKEGNLAAFFDATLLGQILKKFGLQPDRQNQHNRP